MHINRSGARTRLPRLASFASTAGRSLDCAQQIIILHRNKIMEKVSVTYVYCADDWIRTAWTSAFTPWSFELPLLVCYSQVEKNTKGATVSIRLRRCGTGVATPHWCLLGVIAAGRKFHARHRQIDEWGVSWQPLGRRRV